MLIDNQHIIEIYGNIRPTCFKHGTRFSDIFLGGGRMKVVVRIWRIPKRPNETKEKKHDITIHNPSNVSLTSRTAAVSRLHNFDNLADGQDPVGRGMPPTDVCVFYLLHYSRTNTITVYEDEEKNDNPIIVLKYVCVRASEKR